jgi:hypothetical protein
MRIGDKMGHIKKANIKIEEDGKPTMIKTSCFWKHACQTGTQLQLGGREGRDTVFFDKL